MAVVLAGAGMRVGGCLADGSAWSMGGGVRLVSGGGDGSGGLDRSLVGDASILRRRERKGVLMTGGSFWVAVLVSLGLLWMWRVWFRRVRRAWWLAVWGCVVVFLVLAHWPLR